MAGLLGTAICGCSGASPVPDVPFTPSPTPSVTASPSPTSAAPAALAPLTNVGTTSATATRSAVAVVVAGSSPRGLDKADLVVEELADTTRWVALYQSTDTTVGPVASTRPMDPTLLTILHPVYAFSGGTPGMVTRALDSAVAPVNALSSPGDFQGSRGSQTTSTAQLRAAAKAPAAIPLLSYVGPDADPAPGMKAARLLTVNPTGHARQTWTYDSPSARWRLAGGPSGLAPSNVVLQFVDYKSVQLGHPSGAYVPSARVLGDGRAVVATNGKTLDGVWRKVGPLALTTYATSQGVLARMVPGQTVIVLVPTGSSVTIG